MKLSQLPLSFALAGACASLLRASGARTEALTPREERPHVSTVLGFGRGRATSSRVAMGAGRCYAPAHQTHTGAAVEAKIAGLETLTCRMRELISRCEAP